MVPVEIGCLMTLYKLTNKQMPGIDRGTQAAPDEFAEKLDVLFPKG